MFTAALLTGVGTAVVAAYWTSAVAEVLNEKALIEQRYQSEKLVSPAPGGDPDQQRPTVRVTNPPAPTGVIEITVAPFPATEFLANNRWQGFIGDKLVAVIAGGPANTSLGQLMVLTLDRDGVTILETQRLSLPGQPGRARVTSATGTTLSIQTPSGAMFSFDAVAKRLSPSN